MIKDFGHNSFITWTEEELRKERTEMEAENSAGDSKTFSEVNNWQPLAECGYCSICHLFNYLKEGKCEKCRKGKVNA